MQLDQKLDASRRPSKKSRQVFRNSQINLVDGGFCLQDGNLPMKTTHGILEEPESLFSYSFASVTGDDLDDLLENNNNITQ